MKKWTITVLNCMLLASALVAQCTVGTISTTSGSNTVYTCPGDGVPDEITFNSTAANSASQAYVVTDENYQILDITTSNTIDFENASTGTCFVWGFSYSGTIQGSAGESVFTTQFSDGCWLITSNAIRVVRAGVDGGTVATTANTDEYFACLGDGIADYVGFTNTSTSKANYTYVITDDNNIILSLPGQDFADFEGAGVGVCRVWGLSFTGNVLAQVGDDAANTPLTDGCFQLSSNFITVNRGGFEASTISTANGETAVSIDDASNNNLSFTNSTSGSFDYVYVIANESQEIIAFSDGSYDFASLPQGKYFVWGFSYSGDILLSPGSSVFATPFSQGCFQVSFNAIVIQKNTDATADCTADAGTITIDRDPVIQTANSATLSATPDGNAVVPPNYETVYVLTSGTGLVIEEIGATPSFTVTGTGRYTIHTLVAELSDDTDPNYLDASIVVPGQTTGVDVLDLINSTGICASLDAAGAPVEVLACTADAGTITIDRDPVIQTANSATLSATPDGNAVVPPNYETVYVLTSGTGLVIEEIGATPSFTVTGTGRYTIHTLVAELSDDTDPNYLDASIVVPGQTTGVDVLDLINSTGICASLDAAGAPVEVLACTADAGTITIDRDPVIQTANSATLSATPDGNAVVPPNYETVYVLTSGTGLVIEEIGATPSFTVTGTGRYTIHTLVAELSDDTDPNYLDASIVVPGQTTGVDVLDLINSTGICASLDAAGAPVEVLACTADAGTITIDDNTVELMNGMAMLSATPDGNAVVPPNYETVYVLTSGTGLVIEQIGADPMFTVDDTGRYTIHTLVAELSDDTDPNYLDASIVVPGQTTGVDVLNLINSTGICASLDAAGAPAFVILPGQCIADAGTITIDDNTVELMNGMAMLSATPDGNAFVPTGYETVYVLTSGTGLVIEQIGADPMFTVDDTGRYTIHTLVAELSDDTDPNYLDASVIVFGQTTGVDVLNLIASAGICASLDAAGAPAFVILPGQCIADAGTLTIDQPTVELVSGSATVSATPDGNDFVPTGYEKVFVLTSGTGLVIEQLGPEPMFMVTDTGLYTIHTLVAELSDPNDPNFLDASVVVPGQTTGFDVLDLIASLGICASLDAAGAPVQVIPDMFFVDQEVPQVSVRSTVTERMTVFPNPVFADEFTLQLYLDKQINALANIELINALGQVVYTQRADLVKGSNQFSVQVNGLKAGYYIVRIRTATAQWVQPITRK